MVEREKATVVSSNPPCVTINTPLVRKAVGNYLMKATSLEKAQSLVSGFATLETMCMLRSNVLKSDAIIA